MKTKKQYIVPLIALIVLITIFSYFSLNKKEKIEITAPVEQNQVQDNSLDKNIAETSKYHEKIIELPKNIEDKNNINVFLIVSDNKYETSIKENSSVFEAMEKLKNNNFDFKYTNNVSLGNFVTEINGQKGTPGKYWIYYINDKKASIGVSNQILKNGDIIKWSQEGR